MGLHSERGAIAPRNLTARLGGGPAHRLRERALAAGMLLASPMALAGKPIHEVRDVSPDVSVEIQNLAGSVRVTAWDRAQVEIAGTLGDPAIALEVDGGPDRLEISVEFPRGNQRNVEATDLDVRVPRRARLEVETVSASIRVDGVEGDAELSSVSGSIETQGPLGDAELDTVSGTIDAEVTDAMRRGDFGTVSGRIRVHGAFAQDGRYTLESVSGPLELRVPDRLSASFEAETFSGDIDSDVGPAPMKPDRYLPAQELRFSTGSGGARFSLKTFSGKIRIAGQ